MLLMFFFADMYVKVFAYGQKQMFGQLSSLGHQSYLKERSITSLSSNENLWIKGNDFFGPLVSENQEPLLLVNFLVSQSTGTPLNHPDYGLIDTNDTTENRGHSHYVISILNTQ